ncbi:MAG: dihydroorotase [Candidatus Brocadiaceae bacterium]|jgi:dihydroorotase
MEATSVVLIRNARLLDPAGGVDGQRDLLVVAGKVARIAPRIPSSEARSATGPEEPCLTIDAEGLWLLPGLVDIHVHFREPGFTRKETLATGGRAAAAGGYTTVVCEPNTEPPVCTADQVRVLAEKARREAPVHVYFKAAMSRDRAGLEPNDVAELAKQERVVALSDDGDPVVDPALMEEVCRRAAAADIPLTPHCEDSPRALEMIRDGRHPGFEPEEPYTNEPRYVHRDLEIAARCGCRVHFSHVSTGQSVRRIEEYRSRARVSYELTPHHLLLSIDDHGGGEVPQVNPPIRSAADREALQRALLSGSADVIASDHAPHTAADKASGASGLIGLETTLGLMLTHFVAEEKLPPAALVRLMSLSPARLLGLPAGTLQPGRRADMTLVDPCREWTVDPDSFRSLSRNTPFAGRSLRGKAVATWVEGKEVFAESCLEDRRARA